MKENGISLVRWHDELNDKPFILCDDGVSTYSEAAVIISQLAAEIDKEFQGQEVVPVLFGNSKEFIFITLATMASGKKPLPLQPSKKITELQHRFQGLEVKNVITNGCLKGHALNGEFYFFQYSDFGSRCDLSKGINRDFKEITGDSTILCSTSGTTSKPKRVMLQVSRMLENSKAHADSIGLTKDDRILSCLPFYHGMTLLTHIFTVITLDASFVVGKSNYPPAIARVMDTHKVTYTSLVPSLADTIVKNYPKELFSNIESFRRFSVGSAPASIKQLRSYESYFTSVKVYFTYGQTEAGPRISTLPVNGATDDQLCTVGIPLKDTEIFIRNKDENGVGELLVKSRWQSIGYFENEEATSELWEDGYLKTGDLAAFEGGYLALKGRIKDVIISGGVNLSPMEVEGVLNAMPEIAESMVVAKPDARRGEVPCAFLVVQNAIDKDTIVKRLREILDYLKIPNTIYFVDAIAKNSVGKPDRNEMKRLYGLV